MQGTIIRVDVAVGDEIGADTHIAVLEAMKMENNLLAGVDGVVTAVHVGAGDNVAPGTLIVEVRRREQRRRPHLGSGRDDPMSERVSSDASSGSLPPGPPPPPPRCASTARRRRRIVLARRRRNALDYAAVLELVAALAESGGRRRASGSVLLRGEGPLVLRRGRSRRVPRRLSTTAYDFHAAARGGPS